MNRSDNISKRLKKRKVAGEDDIENEVWLNGPDNIIDRMKLIIDKVQKGDGFQQEREKQI